MAKTKGKVELECTQKDEKKVVFTNGYVVLTAPRRSILLEGKKFEKGDILELQLK